MEYYEEWKITSIEIEIQADENIEVEWNLTKSEDRDYKQEIFLHRY